MALDGIETMVTSTSVTKNEEKNKKPVEVIVFHDPAKKKSKEEYTGAKSLKRKGEDGASTEEARAGPSRPVYSQPKAANAIRRLGIQGFGKGGKEKTAIKKKAMVDLLVELGAKKPKNKMMHIQKYNRKKKEEKRIEKEKVELDRSVGIQPLKKKTKYVKERAHDDLLDYVDGMPGFYKHGVQFMNYRARQTAEFLTKRDGKRRHRSVKKKR